MARRSSARLRGQQTVTPSRESPSYDAPISRTPRTLPAKLVTLQESDEMPGAFPVSASPSTIFAAQPATSKNLHSAEAETPTRNAMIQPAAEEMHPQLHYQTTAKPREEARHLGFSNILPQTEPAKRTSRIATLQATPTKSRNLNQDVQSPSFEFTFRREHSLELSPAAKKLMFEKREEAAKIRDQMAVSGEHSDSVEQLMEKRRLAKPKGRFSQAHLKVFDKMDSIAAHPSASKNTTPASHNRLSGTKSLKRDLSKAGLDEATSTPTSRSASRVEGTPSATNSTRRPPYLATSKCEAVDPPAKRTKRTEADDASTTRSLSHADDKSMPSTIKYTPRSKMSKLPHLCTPTQASLARASSLQKAQSVRNTTSLSIPINASPALLARSPSKIAKNAKPITNAESDKAVGSSKHLLTRTPQKPTLSRRKEEESGSTSVLDSAPTALLRQSPLKPPVSHQMHDGQTTTAQTPPVPYLARSPSKLPLSSTASANDGKEASEKPLHKLNLLQRSPIKSILRTPQRLYSDDPAKVAAGTHFATPPKLAAYTSRANYASAPATAPVRKRVDFTSSTIARETRETRGLSSAPSETPTPSPKAHRVAPLSEKLRVITYPDLSRDIATLSPSPEKRRQSSGPRDFTFRAGDQIILFGDKSEPSASTIDRKRSSTIRVVPTAEATAEPQNAGRKKRKFDFENACQKVSQETQGLSDKENAAALAETCEEKEGQRPAKRVKQSAASNPTQKPKLAASIPPITPKRNTLGVKAKGAKTTSPIKRLGTITQARLAALSQPKRR